MLSINTNLSSLIAQGSMKSSTNKLNQAIERMTTGFKINHAKDNAANYSISTNMTTKLNAYDVAADNVAMGMDLVTTASDTVSLMQDKAQRLRALCTQARNGTYGAQSLAAINTEANAIVAEINRIYSTAQYNGVSLFTGGTAEATPAVATFAMRRSAEPEMQTFALTRSANSEGQFIENPVTYTEEEIEAMLASGELVALDNNVTSFTSGKKYLISDETQLVRLATLVNGGQTGSGATFILGADIDLGAYCDAEIANGNGGWTPIGHYGGFNSKSPFEGTFDGNGHVIKNLKIERNEISQGLFGYTASGSEIKNVGLEGGSVKGKDYVGGLAGKSCSISNCYATGTVSGSSDVGGLVGNSDFTISNSYATGDVTGTGSCVGGLAGNPNSISNCYATGTVSGSTKVGGLAGQPRSTISNSYATGTVSGSSYVGGLVGASSSISNSYATGDVTGTDSYVGGLAGNSGSISNCYATGDVTGTDSYVGGLIGQINSYPISNSYAAGTVSGSSYVGGLVGKSYSTISNSYATGTVTGSSNVGGLGSVSGNVTNSAAVQTDSKATVMTVEQIKSTYTADSMGFTEANSWTISGGEPILTWQTTMYSPSPSPGGGGTGGGSSSGGSYGVSAFNLQIGTYSYSSCQIGFDINFTYDLSAIELDIASDDALNTIDNFINMLSEHETKLGAVQNRLESALESIMVSIDNLTSSRSTIRDADIAEVSSHYIQQQILQQASATLLATANQSPSIALQLI